ncbi:MAG TPA: hypothetical protein EYG28_09635 [Nitrospiria bacterium]|nr:hypothetical protein [Candidatus Manganitrophaceae bacterium]HIL35632.1 hypothetical protein [Candidatus Manganitrophaceae bacterium]
MLFSWLKQTKVEKSDPLSVLFVVILFFSGVGDILAQEPLKGSFEAIPVEVNSIRIDGLLQEPVWREGSSATVFTQQEPFVGVLSLTASEVRIAYDEGNLYIGAFLSDPRPDLVQGDERQEDALFDRSDAFAVLIDTYHDHQNGFFFETTPLSAMADALVSQEGSQVNRDWDGKWEVAARRTATGWSAEFRIPFETLRFRSGDAQTWGIQFRRRVPHLKEISFWSPLSAEQTFFEVSRAGHLRGVNPLTQVRPFSIKPYAKGSYVNDKTGINHISETDLDGGLDIRYRFRTNMTLDLTYNTDFAETEVDRIQVNLTRFPLFFPEKREFFLEGKGFYNFGLSGRIQPFFSRRIGLISRQAIPILVGGKLSGKIGPYGVGMLLMETESEGGNPAERFGVLRLSRDIGLRSNVGLIVTERGVRGDSGSETIGVDGALSPNTHLTTNAFWLHSEGDTGRERGQASFGEIQWRDPFWRIRLNHLRIDETFSPALGFVRQTDLIETFGFVDIRPQLGEGLIREIGFKTEMTHQTDDNGNFLYRSNYNRIQADFRSGDFILFSVDPQKERLPEDFQIRPGILIPAGTFTYTHYSIFFFSDSRRPLSTVASILWGGFFDGRKASIDLSLTAAPAEGIKVGAGLEIDQVHLPQGEFTSQIVDGNIAWSLSNRLLLQGLIQWDKEDDSLAANLRLSWEYRENSWFYLIVNPARQKAADTLLILTKITWLWEP